MVTAESFISIRNMFSIFSRVDRMEKDDTWELQRAEGHAI